MRIPFRRDGAPGSADPKMIAAVFGDVRGVSVLSLCSVLADIEENVDGVPDRRFVVYQQRALFHFSAKIRVLFESKKSEIEEKDGEAERFFMKFCLCSRWAKVVQVYLELQSSMDEDAEGVPAAAARNAKRSTGIELFTLKMAIDDLIISIIKCVTFPVVFSTVLLLSLCAHLIIQGIEQRGRSLQGGDLAKL